MPYVDGFIVPVPKKRVDKGDEGSAAGRSMDQKTLPFEIKRMVYGCFRTIVDL